MTESDIILSALNSVGLTKEVLIAFQNHGSERTDWLRERMLLGALKYDVDWSSLKREIDQQTTALSATIKKAFVEHENQVKYLQTLQKQFEITSKVRKEAKAQLEKEQKAQNVLKAYGDLLKNVLELKSEMEISFNNKISNPEKFTVDDVSLFLSSCDLAAYCPHFQEKKINGEKLTLLASVSDFETLGIHDIKGQKRLKLHWSLLENGLFLNPKLNECSIWRHSKTVRDTLRILEEYQIPLPNDKIVEKGLVIGELIFFDIQDIKKEFELDPITRAKVLRRLKDLECKFHKFLAENGKPISPISHSNIHSMDSSTQSMRQEKEDYAATLVETQLPHGAVLTVEGQFNNYWRLKNSGKEAWPIGTSICYEAGEKLPYAAFQIKPALPEETVEISISFKTPPKPGRYDCYFRLVLPNGDKFGEKFWLDIICK